MKIATCQLSTFDALRFIIESFIKNIKLYLSSEYIDLILVQLFISSSFVRKIINFSLNF